MRVSSDRREFRKRLFALVLAVSAVAGCEPRETGMVSRPNILLLTIDTLRADHLGAYGYDRSTSPNLDAFAKESVLFENAFSVSSWTLPAHASLLTGLFPAEHGVVTDISALPVSSETLAEIMSGNGYETFAAVSHVYLTERYGFEQGFDRFDDRLSAASAHKPVAAGIVDRTIDWLAGRESERPFFAWLHIFDPHWDYAPPSPYDKMFDPHYDGSMKGDFHSLSSYFKAAKGYDTPPHFPERDFEHVVALYDGEIAYVDAEVGRLFEHLKSRGVWDETMIAVVSDHGEEFMEHGSLEGHQWTLYDEVVRVPLMLRIPGGRFSGEVVRTPVSTVGLAGTVLDYAGIPQSRPRRSLAAVIESSGGDRPPVPPLLADLTIRREKRLTAIRDGDFKLLRGAEGEVELYRVSVDPGETSDLSAERPVDVERLSKRLDEVLESLAPLPDAGREREVLDPAAIHRLRATGYMD
jgi:arylsulfatase A-like enzyme